MRNWITRSCSVAILAALLLTGCQFRFFSTPTPPTGWRSPVYELLLDETSFPEDWQLGFDVPEHAKGAETNHVTREWWQRSKSGISNQSIWRSYSVDEAQEKYEELIRTRYRPNRPVPSNTLFIEFNQPPEIPFKSAMADQFHLGCGWWDKAYCLTIARYRNYVVSLRIDHQAEIAGHRSNGMTDEEIDEMNRKMDEKFIQFLSQPVLP